MGEGAHDAAARVFGVDAEDALEALHPAHEERRRTGLAGGSVSTVGDDLVAVSRDRDIERAIAKIDQGELAARHVAARGCRPSAFSSAISASEKPASASTRRLCCPRRGAGSRSTSARIGSAGC